MKYSSILVGLAALLPSSLAQKPVHLCEDGNPPEFNLGGYNVGSERYQMDDSANKTPGIIMINHLWRRSFNVSGTEYVMKMWPFSYFNVSYPLNLTHAEIYQHLDEDGEFVFEISNDIFRGVGVEGGDTEISDDEGLYIDFDGLLVKEISFGVRALFFEKSKGANHFWYNETGIINLYKGGRRVDATVTFGNVSLDMEFEEGEERQGHPGDGQETFFLKSDKEFDAVGFVTHSHLLYNDQTNETHDYFLEYLDMCAKPKPIVTGDPHIETWSGMKFDFHGVCDLVLLQNPDFNQGVGMDIHVRTEQLKQFSYVSSAVLRIGDDTLEVMGGNEDSSYWINQQANENSDDGIVGFLGGYPIVYKQVNSKQYEYTVKVGGEKAIVMTTFKKFVRVSIVGATEESFGSSLGLLGSYGAGKMLARDGSTVLNEPNDFGQEWQVLPSEDMLFHSVEGPQAPAKCRAPVASTLRRRLAESKFSLEEAQFACSRVSLDQFDMCVFDVMATGDKEVVGAY